MRILPRVFLIGAVVACIVAAGTVPAAAFDAASNLQETAELSFRSISRTHHAKSRRHLRYFGAHPARMAALARPSFVLMLGIGF